MADLHKASQVSTIVCGIGTPISIGISLYFGFYPRQPSGGVEAATMVMGTAMAVSMAIAATLAIVGLISFLVASRTESNKPATPPASAEIGNLRKQLSDEIGAKMLSAGNLEQLQLRCAKAEQQLEERTRELLAERGGSSSRDQIIEDLRKQYKQLLAERSTPKLSVEIRRCEISELPNVPMRLRIRTILRISNENNISTSVYGWGIAVFMASPVEPHQPRFTVTPDPALLGPVIAGNFLEGTVDFMFNGVQFRDVLRKNVTVHVSDRSAQTWASNQLIIQEFMLQPAQPDSV